MKKIMKRLAVLSFAITIMSTNVVFAFTKEVVEPLSEAQKLDLSQTPDYNAIGSPTVNAEHSDSYLSNEISTYSEDEYDIIYSDGDSENNQEENDSESTSLLTLENNEDPLGSDPFDSNESEDNKLTGGINNSIYTYIKNNDGITITGLINPNIEIKNPVIPSSIDGVAVTKIADEAFVGCECFKGNLTIPGSVKIIGQNAFRNCIGITGLIICDGVEEIVGGSYYDDKYEFNITSGAFSGCIGITGKLVLPDSVKKIGQGSFRNCIGITSVNIPYDVDVIERACFYGCTGLKRIKIEGAETIEYQAFQSCTSLSGNLTLPNTMKTVGYSSFEGCNAISSLTLPSSVKDCFGAFIGCYGVKKIINKSSCKLRIDEMLRDDEEYFINAKTGEKYRRSIDETYVKKGTYIKKDFSKPQKVKKLSLSYASKGIRLSWNKVNGVTGYYVYRSNNGKKYRKVATVTTIPNYPFAKKIIYEDKKAASKGQIYSYKVCAFTLVGKKATKGDMSSANEIIYLEAPEITSIKSNGSKSIRLKWKGNSKYGGYEIQCSRSSKFKDYKTVTIKNGENSSKTISGLWGGRTCYVRIRSLKESGKAKSYSPWSEKVSVDIPR